MSRESLGDPRHNSRIRLRSRRRKSALSTVVSAVIMIAAISIMGSTMLIWAKTVFNAQQKTIGSTYETNSNLLKETFVVEDVWLNKSPVDYVNVTIRNVGDIAINATQVKVTAVNASGGTACASNFRTSWQCDPGTSYTKTTPVPYSANSGNNWILSKGLISSKGTLRVDIANIDWDNPNSKTLNIQVTTARGSIQNIIWQVA